jgi:aspyridone synthetase (hybrid polyketide synthase/nonribosomal peptide synthetase)
MGRELLEHCPRFKISITDCEEALTNIPKSPLWSLGEELLADSTKSRVSEAQLSQHLCTAIQIALVDIFKSCGTTFSSIVGHSSGKIAAAYAAGLLTRRNAMGISYYRGYVAHLASRVPQELEGMMAAAISFKEASKLCSQSQFRNRLTVAACNSPSSVTLEGDRDALAGIEKYLTKINVQNRDLQVKVAYHSNHMVDCADAYLGHLEKLNVRIQTPPANQQCQWYSSVRTNASLLERPFDSGLESQYWLDNMVQPVLFTQAITRAAQVAPSKFTFTMEIGPRPAFKGPTTQTLKHAIDSTP